MFKKISVNASYYPHTGRHPLRFIIRGTIWEINPIDCKNKSEAIKSINDIYGIRNNHNTILFEEFLKGIEASLFIISNGNKFKSLGSAQDYKKIYKKDLGPNTGGMGAFSPSLNISPEMEKDILKRIVSPTLKEMDKRGTPFSGILYVGLMITNEGPKLIENNVRLCDPE